MRFLRLVMLLASFGSPVLVARSATPDNAQQFHVMFSLSDGSQICGVSALRALPVQTSYAAMEIPLANIRDVAFGEDHATVTLIMANGDRLTATTTLKELKLEAQFGKITVPVAVLKRIMVIPNEAATPPRNDPPAPTRRRSPASRVVYQKWGTDWPVNLLHRRFD